MSNNINISFVIPTFNSENTLEECLRGITFQDYPSDQVEIIVVDGYSDDKTIQIAKKYDCVVVFNGDIIHPKGRPLGIEQAKGNFICCLDSDNIIIEKNWISKMLTPFDNIKVVASEPLHYLSRESDSILTKYISCSGVDDPIVLEIGNYDRYSQFTGNWTSVPVNETYHRDYILVDFEDKGLIPSLGANGCIFRRKEILKTQYNPFHHIDVSHQIISKNNVLWAKVECGVVHLHGDKIYKFILKKSRRALRRLDSKINIGYRFPLSYFVIFRLVIRSLFLLPLIKSIIVSIRMKSLIPLLHFPIYYLTLANYAFLTIRKLLHLKNGNQYEKV